MVKAVKLSELLERIARSDAMDDNKFAFDYCPECGGSVKRGGLFSGMGMVLVGKNGRCIDCGKEWHVIWENADNFGDADDEE
jgi:hypothetical protein